MSSISSTRLKLLKEQLFHGFFVKKEWWGDDLTIFNTPEVEKMSISMRKALAFEKVCLEMPLEIKPHELIVGLATMSSVGFGHTFPKYETDEEAKYFAQFSLDRKSVWGHHMPYYKKLLEVGYSGILAEIDHKLKTETDPEAVDFLSSAAYTLKAAAALSKRYEALIKESAQSEQDDLRRTELLELSRICARVPNEPAESFHEALQSVWFVHMLLHSTLSYTPLGRIDQYLWPYYEKDFNEGRLTRQEAKDLIGSFLIKFNERTQFRSEHMENHMSEGDWSQGGDPNEPTTTFDMENDADYNFGQSANHWLQSATVGGLKPDGTDATNELSYLFIETLNELELVSPMISARLSDLTPKEYTGFVGGELCEGGAQPVLFNDEVIIKGLTQRLNIPKEDAFDYASDGCWEVLIYGRTEYSYGHIEVMPCMEALFNKGCSFVTGRKIGVDPGETLTSLNTFDEFYEAYFEQVRYRIDNAVKNKMKYYDKVHQIAPEPYLSALVDDCIENGRDLTNRGARYRIYSLFATGLSHCIDSLSAIKKLVYDEKRLTLLEAASIIKDNWKDNEALRQYCLNKTPKYGNDDKEADAILVRFMNDFCDRADYWNSSIDWLTITAGVATFENYPRFGRQAWASFDGRFAHEAFSSNYSPAVGRDQEGPTAVVLSSTKVDLSRLNSGCPIDLRISFNKNSKDECKDILSAFIESFRSLGGNIMTITKVDIETLKKAQENPEQYMSLRVRLGGLTVYFVQLAKAQQDEYMRRTEHNF